MTTLDASFDLPQWCHQQLDQGRTPWAVVDASGAVNIRALEARAQAQGCVNLLAHRTSAPDALAIAPRMLALQTPGLIRAVSRLWAEQTVDEPVLFFVSSAMGAGDFTAAMQRRVSARLTGGDTMLLRWWDARIWWALNLALPSDEPLAMAFFGALAQSVYPDRDGQLKVVDHPAARQDTLATDWELDDAALGTLLALGEPDAVLGICREDYPDALQAVAPHQRYALAHEQLQWARQQGLTSPQDHALATRIAATEGPDWGEQAEWQTLISKAKASGQTLRDTLAALND